MDGIFDRLGDLLRSIVQSDDAGSSAGARGFADPDMQEAWEELDDYLNPDREERRSQSGRRTAGEGRTSAERAHRRQGPPEELRKDYGNLEVAFGAPFDEVRKAYKNLLVEYHPDKHSSSAEKLRIATEITKKVNASFQRIKRYHDTGTI
ncbi:J domain-containing protein [Salinispira pacifica]